MSIFFFKAMVSSGVQTTGHRDQQQKGPNSNSSNLTEAAERAMALRMDARHTTSLKSESSMNTPASISNRPSVIKTDTTTQNRDGSLDDVQNRNYFSAPVFPGQMNTMPSPATPYHAAAQQYQQASGSYQDGNNSSSQSGGSCNDLAQQFGSPQKGLPGFADFRRPFGVYSSSPGGGSNNNGYPSSYPTSMPPTSHFSSGGAMTVPASYSSPYGSPSMLPPPSSFFSGIGKPIPGSYDSMVPYPGMKMPVFPGMQTHGLEDAGPGMQQQGSGQQYDPMLQFQPLGS